jgi:hypothetical protein
MNYSFNCTYVSDLVLRERNPKSCVFTRNNCGHNTKLRIAHPNHRTMPWFTVPMFVASIFCEAIIHLKVEVVELTIMMAQNTCVKLTTKE